MKHHLACAIAVIVFLGLAPSRAISAVTRPGLEAQRQAEDIATAIVISAEQTRRQVERSEATIQALYGRLDSEAAKTRAALLRANLSDHERRKLVAELGRLREEQAALIAKMAARDAEYATSIRAYRDGLTGLLTDNDPRVVSILKRYADGDSRAADELQELTRIIRKSRNAGVRERDGAEQRAVARVWTDEMDKGRKTTAQALTAWQEAASMNPEHFRQWIEISRLQQQAGNLVGAREAADQARAVATEKRDLSLSHEKIGNVAVAQGRLGDARRAYEESLETRRDLLSADPTSARAKRDVSVSLNMIGDVAVFQGRLGDARTAHEESLEIRRDLLSANPSDLKAKRDVHVSLSKIGDVAADEGRLGDARIAYEESLMISRALLAENPSSSKAKRDVHVGLNKIGDVAVNEGRLVDARRAYEESLEISRGLLSTDPSSAEAKRDVSVGLIKIGDVAVAQGRLGDARAAYEKSLEIGRGLLSSNQSNAEAKRDISRILDRIGDVAVSQGRLDGARTSYEESLVHSRALLSANPSSTQAKRDISSTLDRIGNVAVSQGRLDDARTSYEESLALSRALLSANPSNAQAKRDVMISHFNLSQLTEKVEHLRAVLALAEEMERDGSLASSDRPLMEALRAQLQAPDVVK